MSDYSMIAEEALVAGSVFAVFGVTLAFIIAVYAFIILFYVALFVGTRIPYYRMAKRAGVPYAWLIWIPIAEMYVLLNLTKREFNIFNWIKTKDRTKVFWYWLIGIGAFPIGLIFFLCLFSMIPVLNIIAIIMYYVILEVYMIAVYIFNWRIYYDLLMTYGMQEHAMWVSIASCFYPLIMIVFSYMIMNKDPDYSI